MQERHKIPGKATYRKTKRNSYELFILQLFLPILTSQSQAWGLMGAGNIGRELLFLSSWKNRLRGRIKRRSRRRLV
jgi:hypothetical protein